MLSRWLQHPRNKPRFFPRNLSFGEIMRAMSAQLSFGEFYPPLHEQFCRHGSDAANGLINRRARSRVAYHSEAISQVLARTLALLTTQREAARTHPTAIALRVLPRLHRNPVAGQLEYLPATRRLNLS